jgi:hypothetical protein
VTAEHDKCNVNEKVKLFPFSRLFRFLYIFCFCTARNLLTQIYLYKIHDVGILFYEDITRYNTYMVLLFFNYFSFI